MTRLKSQTLQNIASFLAKHPRWLFAAALLYLFSPVDLIPEIFLGPLGYVDDLFVLLLPYIATEYVRRRKVTSDIHDTTADDRR